MADAKESISIANLMLMQASSTVSVSGISFSSSRKPEEPNPIPSILSTLTQEIWMNFANGAAIPLE